MHRPDPFFQAFETNTLSGNESTKQATACRVSLSHKKRFRTIPKLSPASCPRKKSVTEHPSTPFSIDPNPSGHTLVADPIAVLRHCIRYFYSNTDIYGTNIQALLDREVMHVMRLKASEMSIIGAHPITYAADGGISWRNGTLPIMPQAKTAGSNSTTAVKPSAAVTSTDSVFGYGGVSFVPPTEGFLALLDAASSPAPKNFGANLPEIIGWGGSLETDTHQSDSVSPFPCTRPPSGQGAALLPSKTGATSHIMLDGNGYEISYLRGRIHQLEASYNAQAVRLHELSAENKQLIIQVDNAETNAKKWRLQYDEAQAQLLATRREVDGWRNRATGAAVSAANKEIGRTTQRHKSQILSANGAQMELQKLTQLWRETERALQESRRALENSEKEASQSNDHLSDAFDYIERLERRVVRRESYISIMDRRQSSLEEKYEKLMWCFEEMATLTGASSYVDYLLADDPIWSLFLFIRLQRHVGAYFPVSVPMSPKQQESASQGRIVFVRSPGGAKLMDTCFNPSLVYSTMANESTAVNDRRGKSKKMRTNLHGTVGCRVLRWWNHFSIDYLGGEENFPDTCEMNKRKLPLLTLASLLLPLRRANGALLSQSVPADGIEKEEAASSAPSALEPAINHSKEYDASSIRFLMRCFWGGRVARYKADMNRRLAAVVRRKQKDDRRAARATRGASNGIQEEGMRKEENDQSSDDEESQTVPSTFLAALVAFVLRVVHRPTSTSVPKGSPDDDTVPLVVKGYLSRKAPGIWDNGRIFFASILHASSRKYSVSGEGTEPPPEITPAALELLAALYYYTMELRESDADFRLFYLVSHQFVPETVGVNFFASIEAFQQSCQKTLLARLGGTDTSSPVMGLPPCFDSSPSMTSIATLRDHRQSSTLLEASRTSPLEALFQVCQMVDRAPLLAEGEALGEDSGSEGYGSVLPGEVFASSKKSAGPRPQPSNLLSMSRTSSFTSSRGSPPQNARGEKDKQLVHNIRDYIKEIQKSRRDRGEVLDKSPRPSSDSTTRKVADVLVSPEPWVDVDKNISVILGTHTSILKSFNELRDRSPQDEKAFFPRARAERAAYADGHGPHLAAVRGLLPLDNVLDLFHAHCFTSYALSCCGTPRFSLVDTLCPPISSQRDDYLDPLTPIGQLPPLSIHLQRLRFALALDQPAALIHYRHLFDFDPCTAAPTHLYDEYLTLSLDIYTQQQTYMMNTVLSACAVRHERFKAEGTEDCDGNIPISFLRKGLEAGFLPFGLQKTPADAFLQHLRNYDQLLREEDEVRLEQFNDAPFYMNTDAAGKTDAEKDRGFDLKEESETCSLMNLAMAIRSTYFVWGNQVHSSALQFMSAIASVSLQSHSVQLLHTATRPTSVGDILESHRCAFAETVKHQYTQSVLRFSNGGTEGSTLQSSNLLRRTVIHQDTDALTDYPGTAISNIIVPELPKSNVVFPNLKHIFSKAAASQWAHVVHAGEHQPKRNVKEKKAATAKPAAVQAPPPQISRAIPSITSDETLYTLVRVLGLNAHWLPIHGRKKLKKSKVYASDMRGAIEACAHTVVSDLVANISSCVDKLSVLEGNEIARSVGARTPRSRNRRGGTSLLTEDAGNNQQPPRAANDARTVRFSESPSVSFTLSAKRFPSSDGLSIFNSQSGDLQRPNNALSVTSIYPCCAALSLMP